MKMSLRLSQSFCSCGSAKQVYILAIAWPLSTVSVATTASFASPWQWSPVQAKMSQKPWCWLTRITQHIASKKTCKDLYVRVPAKKQERAEEERPFLFRDVWDNLVLRTSNTPTTFVPCVSLVACTSGIPQNWLQHRWHRCSWNSVPSQWLPPESSF